MMDSNLKNDVPMPECQQIAEVDGVNIAFYDLPATGERQGTVLLIHGFASNGLVNWISTGWTKALRDGGFRTLVVDNRGHGNSTNFILRLIMGQIYLPMMPLACWTI